MDDKDKIQLEYNEALPFTQEVWNAKSDLEKVEYAISTEARVDMVMTLAEYRWRLCRDAFAYNESNATLLMAFNKRLIGAMIRLYHEMHVTKRYVRKNHPEYGTSVKITGNLCPSQEYPTENPDQSDLEKEVWAILTEPVFNENLINEADPLLHISLDDEESNLELCNMLYGGMVFYRDDTMKNWSKKMDLCIAFWHFYLNDGFALKDLLWLQNFTMRIGIEYRCK
jgi:phage pi2 protein 07